MNKIPLVDLKRQYISIKAEIDQAISKIVSSTSFIMGKPVRAFEEAFANAAGMNHAVSASSGTTALHLALTALGVSSGDEVITAANTFIGTTEAITQTGARVVFVDVDEKTYNIDPTKIEQAITSKTKAIVPVHLFGQMADMSAISKIAKDHQLFIVEDAAQAHLAEFEGQAPGTHSHAACYSFYPGKNLGAFGDAGAVVTQDETLAKKMRMLADHGRTTKYEHEIEGFNYRMDALQAAILNVKLKHLPDWTQARGEIARQYNDLFNESGITIPFVDERAKHVFHLYVVRLQNRDEVRGMMSDQGIGVGIHYPIPLHLQKAYAYLGYKQGDFPISERCAKEILSLPIFPELASQEVGEVATTLRQALHQPAQSVT